MSDQFFEWVPESGLSIGLTPKFESINRDPGWYVSTGDGVRENERAERRP